MTNDQQEFLNKLLEALSRRQQQEYDTDKITEVCREAGESIHNHTDVWAILAKNDSDSSLFFGNGDPPDVVTLFMNALSSFAEKSERHRMLVASSLAMLLEHLGGDELRMQARARLDEAKGVASGLGIARNHKVSDNGAKLFMQELVKKAKF